MAGTLTISTLSDGTNSTSSTNCIQGSAKAWVNLNGSGGASIRASYNVSSVTRSATGQYAINFTNAFADTNYTPTCSVNWDNASAGMIASIDSTPTTTSVRYRTGYGYFTAADVTGLYVAVFR